MRPPCEIIVRSILPAFRSLIARELIEKYNLTQASAAEKLGTTQAAISHYLYSKRGKKYIEQLEAIPEIRSVASEVAKGLMHNEVIPIDAITKFCTLCIDLRTEDIICKIHKEFVTLPEACRKCLNVLGSQKTR